MKTLYRTVVTFVSAVATLYFVFWVGGAFLLSQRLPPWIPLLGAAVVAISVGRYVWLRTASVQLGLASSIGLGALVTGGIGFAVGFFGPIIFMPQSNQGPLLGIFVTGPLGCLFGGVVGAVYWFIRRHREAQT